MRFVVALALFAVPSMALAQSRDLRPPVTIDMEEDLILGGLQGPSHEIHPAPPKYKHKSLIQIRKNFRPEVLRTGAHL